MSDKKINIKHQSDLSTRLFWWFFDILAVLTAVLLILQVVFWFASDRIIGKVVRETVEIKSEKLYQLSYSHIRLNFLKGILEIDSLNLRSDTVVYRQLKQAGRGKNNLLEIFIPSVRATGFNFFNAYFGRQLHLNSLKIDKPFLKIAAYADKPKPREEAFKIRNIYYLIANYLDLAQIDSWQVTDGAFAFNSRHEANVFDISFKNINLNIHNFYLDSLTYKNDKKPFLTNNIDIDIGENLFVLPNTPFVLKTDSIKVSTRNQSFFAKNIEIIQEDEEKNRLLLPIVRFIGLDFRQAYFNKKLHINEINIPQPSVSWQSKKTIEKNAFPSARISEVIFEVANAYFQEVWLKKIDVQRLNIKTNMPVGFENVSFALHHFFIDSTFDDQKAKHWFVKDVDIELFDYRHKLFKTSRLWLSTAKKEVLIDKLEVAQPNAKIFFPSISLSGFEAWKLYDTRNFVATALLLKNPRLELTNKSNIDADTTENSNFVLLDLGKDWLRKALKNNIGDFYLGAMQLENGNLTVDNSFVLKGISAEVLAVSSPMYPSKKATDLQILNAKHWSVASQDAFFRLDAQSTINAQNISFSTQRALLSCQSLTWTKNSKNPEKEPQLAFNATKIAFEGVDFRKLIFHKSLKIKKIALEKLEGKIIENNETKIEATVTSLEHLLQSFFIEEVDLQNTDIEVFNSHLQKRLALSQAQFKLENLQKADSIGLATLLPPPFEHLQAEKIEFSSENLFFRLTDSIHALSAEKLHISAHDSLVSIKNFQIQPFRNQDELAAKKKNYVDVLIPELIIRQLDVPALYYHRQLYLKKLLVDSIFIAYHTFRKPDTTRQFFTAPLTALPEKLLTFWKILKINELAIHHAGIDVLAHLDDREAPYTLQASANMQNLTIDSASHAEHKHLEGFTLRIGNFFHQLPTGTHVIKLDSAMFDSHKAEFSLYRFKLLPKKTEKAMLPLYYFYFPSLTLKKMDWEAWFNNGYLKVDSLLVQKPYFEILNQANNSPKRRFFDRLPPDSLYAILPKHILKGLQIGYTDAKNAIIRLHTLHQNEDNDTTTVAFDNSNWQLFDFLATATHDSTRQLPVRDLRLQVPEYQHSFSWLANDYTVKLLNINLSTAHKLLLADSLIVAPREDNQDDDEDQNRLIFEIYSLKTKLRAEGFDIEKLLFDKQLKIKNLLLSKSEIEIYRDKKKVPKTGKFPPLRKKKKKKRQMQRQGIVVLQSRLMPQEALLKSGLNLYIDTVKVSEGRLDYEEISPYRPDQAGEFFMDSLNMTILKVVSDSATVWRDSVVTTLDIQARLMGAGKIRLNINFPMKDRRNTFYMRGQLDEFEMAKINPIMENLVFIKIKEGMARKMEFEAAADEKQAIGKMRFRYDGLKVEVIDRKLLTFLANALVIHANNPKNLFYKVREGDIYYKRQPDRSIFSYTLRVLISGLKESIGLKNKDKPKAK